MLVATTLVSAALALLGPLPSALLAQEPTLEFHEIGPLPPGRVIDLVHVESEAPSLRLTLYDKEGEILTWSEPRGGVARAPLQLVPEEVLELSPDLRHLAVVTYALDCLDSPLKGLTLRTELRFPRVFTPFPPPPPGPIPGPTPPGPLDLAWDVHVGLRGRILVYTRAGLESSRPTEVRVFERTGAGGGSYRAAGAYVNQVHGEVQTAPAAGLIAQAEGDEVRLLKLGPTGVVEVDRVPLGLGFQLAPDGEHLAVLGMREVVLHTLSAGRAQSHVLVAVQSRPLGVTFGGNGALILAREHLMWIDAASGQPVWGRESSAGLYASADVAELEPGGLVFAEGRCQVVDSPARLQKKHEDGSANAFVEVRSASGQRLGSVLTFPTHQWTRHQPRVLVLAQARRVLAYTGDAVWITDRIP